MNIKFENSKIENMNIMPIIAKNFEDEPPTILVPLYIDGFPEVGRQLVAKVFSKGQKNISYQWYKGATIDTSTNIIPDAIFPDYIPQTSDVGNIISVKAIISNDYGSVEQIAHIQNPVTNSFVITPDPNPDDSLSVPPSFVSGPTIIGTPQVGRTLSCDVDIQGATGIKFQWRSDDDAEGPIAPNNIIGAANSSYSPSVGYIDKHLQCVVEAINAAGTTVANSDYTEPVTEADVLIPSGAIVIDQAWLDAQGGTGPYYLNQADKYYYLDTDVFVGARANNPTGNYKQAAFYLANRNITFDLNGHTITYEATGSIGQKGSTNGYNRCGIISYLNWNNTEKSIPNSAEAKNCIVKNGKIQISGSGPLCHGIYGYRANGIKVENVEIISSGKDSFTVYFIYNGDNVGPSQYYDNIFRNNSNDTYNRHQGPSNLKTSGKIIAERNVFIGGNSSIVCGSNSIIRNNVLGHSGFATNGYGVWLYRNNDVLVENNLIIPTNGRGVLCNAGFRHVIKDNVIFHTEAPNAEFGDSLNPPAIRVRYDAGGIKYYNNTSLGLAGYINEDGKKRTSASSMYIGTHGKDAQGGNGPCEYYNNKCTTILFGTPSLRRYCQPLTFESHGKNTDPITLLGIPGEDKVYNNLMQSNMYLYRNEGADGFSRSVESVKNNTWEWIEGQQAYEEFFGNDGIIEQKFDTLGLNPTLENEARTYIESLKSQTFPLMSGLGLQDKRSTYYVKFFGHENQLAYCDLIDNIYGSGVNPKSYTWQYTNNSDGPVRIRIGNTKTINILSNLGNPIINSTGTIISNEGDISNFTTDANGNANLIVYDFGIEKRNSAAGSPFATIDRTSSTIVVNNLSGVITHSSIPASIILS